MGQHDRRSQGPADRLGPVRQAVPGHAAADRAARRREVGVEPIDVPIGEAQGLLWAFDSLYVVVNRGRRYDSGLYRVTDTNNDDRLDKVELLRKLDGGGEHGPHAVILAPDGKSLYVVAGNATALTKLDGSLVPRVWGEDNLIPRMVDGAGFMTDEKAPGGHICRVSPDGKHWELVAIGYRNPFDIAFNRAGELFTYDSDMEWDVNMPWYRPTRVLHVASGGDYGYRNGSGKWPPYYIDSLPPVVNVGPGSPTGVAFGYGAKFPVKYQEALYLCDWSYGKLYALHLDAQGRDLRRRARGVPGGNSAGPDRRRHQSQGWRDVLRGRRAEHAIGPLSRDLLRDVSRVSPPAVDRRCRRPRQPAACGTRSKRSTATRTRGPSRSRGPTWATPTDSSAGPPGSRSSFRIRHRGASKALAETSSPEAALNALLALTHVSAQDPAHRANDAPAPDPRLRDQILAALDRIAWDQLNVAEQLDLLRVYEVVLNRFGRPDRVDGQRG